VDILARIISSPLEVSAPVLLLALLAGIGVFVVFAALVVPASGRPKRGLIATQKQQFGVLQIRLTRAQIEVPATEYVKRSLTLGIPLGLGLFILIGSFTLIGVGVLAGFMITWTTLEQERDRKQVRYTKQLAGACDTIRTAYGVNPSLKKALEAVAEYGTSPVKEDFQEILVAASQERFIEGLQAVADRRSSIVFDTVSTSLIRASEASGEVNEMLSRLAESTRQNVAAFEEALTSQLNARSSIQWGTYGPWLIFCVFRLMTVMMSFTSGGNVFAPMTTYFSTPAGNVLTLAAAGISMFIYRNCLQISQRGLVVRRVNTTEAVSIKAQKAMVTPPEVALSAQSRPVSMG
jgi:Flp pilus assembly protein TadB